MSEQVDLSYHDDIVGQAQRAILALEERAETAERERDEAREQVAALQAVIDGVKALHKPKASWSEWQDEYRDICDYDKTAWPCRTEGILSQAPADALTEHDRQVAERAWSEGHSRGVSDERAAPAGAVGFGPFTSNPYTAKENPDE